MKDTISSTVVSISESDIESPYMSDSLSSESEWAQDKHCPARNAYSVECAVPTFIRDTVLPEDLAEGDLESGADEFTHVRYTAATCDPDDFVPHRGYTLRPVLHQRRTELLISITCYNEGKAMTARSLAGVAQNIRDIVQLEEGRRKTYWTAGGPAWQKIVVCIVFDGLDPLDKTNLDLLAAIGLYQDGLMRSHVDGEETVAHVFEYTTRLSVDLDEGRLVVPRPVDEKQPRGLEQEPLPPIQMILCLKQRNTKKINSHRWALNAFGRQLDPAVCVLVDVGTVPGPKSVLRLWEAFYHDKTLGAACGEMETGSHFSNFANPLMATQKFEYKISHIIDKPLESTFGFIAVLPGAYSAYRFAAITGRPLDQYFRGDRTSRLQQQYHDEIDAAPAYKGVFMENMFLAEDRILCFEILAKADACWHVGFVREAKCVTDIPEDAPELLAQRRRWLNGAFAAALYSLAHFRQIYSTRHSLMRKILLHLQLGYNIVTSVLSWFAPSVLWLTTIFIMSLIGESTKLHGSSLVFFGSVGIQITNTVVQYIYIIFLVLQFALALGTRPKDSPRLYKLSFGVFAAVQLYVLVLCLYMTVVSISSMLSHESGGIAAESSNGLLSHVFISHGPKIIIVALTATVGLFLVTGLMCLDPWHLATCFLQYVLIIPSFVNILMVYAFCNWHDVSWGTKGASTSDVFTHVQGGKENRESMQLMDEKAQSLPQTEVDAQYEIVLARALAPCAEGDLTGTAKLQSKEDAFKKFRTGMLVGWIMSNFFVSVLVGSESLDVFWKSDPARMREASFFTTLLWLTAGLSSIRFLGSLWYLVSTKVTQLVRKMK